MLGNIDMATRTSPPRVSLIWGATLLACALLAMLPGGDAFMNPGIPLSGRSSLPRPPPRSCSPTRSCSPARVVSLAEPVAAAKVASAILSAYLGLLHAHPLGTKVVTAAVLSTAGDVIAQQLTCRREQRKLPAVLRGKLTRSKWDLKRTMMFAAFGGFYTGAVQHVWFGLLNSPAVAQLLPAFGTSGVSQALARVLINQLIVTPLLYFPLFYAWRGFCRSESVPRTLTLARKECWPTLKLNWAFWLPAQALVFACFSALVLACFSVTYHVPLCCLLALVWTCLLSFASVAHDTPQPTASPATAPPAEQPQQPHPPAVSTAGGGLPAFACHSAMALEPRLAHASAQPPDLPWFTNEEAAVSLSAQMAPELLLEPSPAMAPMAPQLGDFYAAAPELQPPPLTVINAAGSSSSAMQMPLLPLVNIPAAVSQLFPVIAHRGGAGYG
ncbi:hypothetical protein T484DRAFT_1920083 [Baffinella frigidus]|nr:hypothetical protein T484DRAFT_1920083 [Cryptophyta sp. CCMP2293]